MPRRVRVANPRRSSAWLRGLAFALLASLAALPVVVGIACAVLWLRASEGLPAIPDLAARAASSPATSRIVAADGTLLELQPFVDGKVVGDREWVRFERMPPVLVQAILAAEDVRFMAHGGVDLRAVARAAWQNWRAGRTVEGASTITQQVARLLLPDDVGHARTIERKLREAVIARRLERTWTKQAILEIWANEAYLGAGAYGVAAAARRTFGKSLAALDLAEAATIAGLAQAPVAAHPSVAPALARARRDEVLARMRKAGYIDDGALAAAVGRPLDGGRPGELAAPAPWLVEQVRRELVARDPEALARGGLRVETTALPLAAAAAEEALASAAQDVATRQHGPVPQGALVAIDHVTGAIEALVGGTRWTGPGFDRAVQACRQPGSAFKPIVYAAALAAGTITPGTVLLDAPVTDWDAAFLSAWKPSNAGHAHRGPVLASDALAASLNPPAIEVFDRVGGTKVIETARRLGIASDLVAVRPLALGSSCLRPLELARAFTRLAAGGREIEPRTITRIVRVADGAVLLDDAEPVEPWLDPARRLDRLAARGGAGRPQALDGATAWMTMWMLGEVVARGTGHDAASIGRPAAGKTGTTNDGNDAWFVGSTARLTAVAWLGHDRPSPLGPKEDGAHAALPAWVRAIRALEDGRPPAPVQGPPPDGIVLVRVDSSGRASPTGRPVPFPTDAAPSEATAPAASTDLDDSAREF